MTKIITIAVIAAAILLAGTAVVYAQTTDDNALRHMPMWGVTDGHGGNYYDEMADYCLDATATADQAQEHYQQMDQHMQDGTYQDHMGDGTWQDHMNDGTWQDLMGDGTYQNHMGDGTYQGHMNDGTWQDHMGDGTYQNHMGDGTWQQHHGTTDAGTGDTGYGHMGGGHMGM